MSTLTHAIVRAVNFRFAFQPIAFRFALAKKLYTKAQTEKLLDSQLKAEVRPAISTVKMEDSTIRSFLRRCFPDQKSISFVDLDTGTGAFIANFETYLGASFPEVHGIGIEPRENFYQRARSLG